jgi:ABC-type antimicrobial peptide transport system permease subunit
VLGAQTSDVIRLVCRQACWSLGAGIAAGIGLALAAGRVMAAQGYWTAMPSGLLLGATTVLFVGGATLALLFPTRAATRIDPAEVLKESQSMSR